jgi:cell division septum initiation protein DivIVA
MVDRVLAELADGGRMVLVIDDVHELTSRGARLNEVERRLAEATDAADQVKREADAHRAESERRSMQILDSARREATQIIDDATSKGTRVPAADRDCARRAARRHPRRRTRFIARGRRAFDSASG